MNGNLLVAIIALGVSVLSYLDAKEHRDWERSRDQSQL